MTKGIKPLWKGPTEDGITFSMLSKFLVCRERFRLQVIEGLRPEDRFSHKIEYGNMWHLCDEMYEKAKSYEKPLSDYVQALIKKYPLDSTQILHWWKVVLTQFPLYILHRKRTSKPGLISVATEQVFDVPYELPSGRTVRLRGKVDEIMLRTEKGRGSSLFLKETKTKGDIDEVNLVKQLTFDLQIMKYMVAMTQDTGIESLEKIKEKAPVQGVIYNVIRRPLSGGKGSIVRHKETKNKPAETEESFYQRVGDYIVEEPERYFMRWTVEITKDDITRFRHRCLNPLLEDLCSWYMEVTGRDDPFSGEHHWVYPYGVYNPLNDGGMTDLDECVNSGSTVGLKKVFELFSELHT